MELQPALLSAAIVFLAYLVRGISGFGSALVAMPLLAHFHPLTFAVPWIASMDLLAAIVMTRSGLQQSQVHWKEIGYLLPAASLGILVGVQLLVQLDREALLSVLGLLVIGFGLRGVLGLHGNRPVSRLWSLPAGILGGGIGAVFSTGGPPFVIYLSHRIADGRALRATLSGLFMIEGSIRLTALLLAGLLAQQQLLWYLLAGIPLMAAGLHAGHRIHVRLSQPQMQMAIGMLLVGSGASLLWRVYGSPG